MWKTIILLVLEALAQILRREFERTGSSNLAKDWPGTSPPKVES